MRFFLTRDAAKFAVRTAALIEPRIEFNVMASTVANVIDGVYAEALFAYGLDDERGELRFAAMRTPPWSMLATSGLEEGAVPEFVARWLEEDPDLPGVNGLPETTREIAAAWREQTGGTSRCHMREAMHVLEEVRDPPRPAAGELRLARTDERGLMVDWMNAFVSDAGLVSRGEAEVMVDVRLAREALLVWDHNGPVSIVGAVAPVAGVARIGPVYTPREHRSRGYASSAVAAVSRRELARGARACMLFTDLANPTSNKIYAEVGYRRCADWEEYVFERA